MWAAEAGHARGWGCGPQTTQGTTVGGSNMTDTVDGAKRDLVSLEEKVELFLDKHTDDHIGNGVRRLDQVIRNPVGFHLSGL